MRRAPGDLVRRIRSPPGGRARADAQVVAPRFRWLLGLDLSVGADIEAGSSAGALVPRRRLRQPQRPAPLALYSSIDPSGLDTSDFMAGERIIRWKGTPDTRPMGRVLSIDERGNIELVIYFDGLEDATFEPTTVAKVTEQQGNLRITRRQAGGAAAAEYQGVDVRRAGLRRPSGHRSLHAARH